MADTLDTINCPACGEEMVKVYIPREGINIDVCLNGCGGIYFDNREFKRFDECHENIDEILNALKGKDFKRVDMDSVRLCPVCGARMVKNYSSIKKEIQVDDCYMCGGKFLDHGELERIRKEYNTDAERGEATIKFLYDVAGSELQEIDLSD
ncbi:zf-TFIIB domain-containing protein [bacterium]|nr:zf-TFIIB domain-containing protein [bacterium]